MAPSTEGGPAQAPRLRGGRGKGEGGPRVSRIPRGYSWRRQRRTTKRRGAGRRRPLATRGGGAQGSEGAIHLTRVHRVLLRRPTVSILTFALRSTFPSRFKLVGNTVLAIAERTRSIFEYYEQDDPYRGKLGCIRKDKARVFVGRRVNPLGELSFPDCGFRYVPLFPTPSPFHLSSLPKDSLAFSPSTAPFSLYQPPVSRWSLPGTGDTLGHDRQSKKRRGFSCAPWDSRPGPVAVDRCASCERCRRSPRCASIVERPSGQSWCPKRMGGGGQDHGLGHCKTGVKFPGSIVLEC